MIKSVCLVAAFPIVLASLRPGPQSVTPSPLVSRLRAAAARNAPLLSGGISLELARKNIDPANVRSVKVRFRAPTCFVRTIEPAVGGVAEPIEIGRRGSETWIHGPLRVVGTTQRDYVTNAVVDELIGLWPIGLADAGYYALVHQGSGTVAGRTAELFKVNDPRKRYLSLALDAQTFVPLAATYRLAGMYSGAAGGTYEMRFSEVRYVSGVPVPFRVSLYASASSLILDTRARSITPVSAGSIEPCAVR